MRKLLLRAFGFTHRWKEKIRTWYWRQLFASMGDGVHIYGPITVHLPQQVRVGAHTVINEDVILHARGGITIGEYAHISSRVIINSAALNYMKPREGRDSKRKPVVIRDGAWICSGAIINPGVTIGEDAVVGPGVIVTRDVPDRGVVSAPAARTGALPQQ